MFPKAVKNGAGVRDNFLLIPVFSAALRKFAPAMPLKVNSVPDFRSHPIISDLRYLTGNV
jgi:hypothetical protein